MLRRELRRGSLAGDRRRVAIAPARAGGCRRTRRGRARELSVRRRARGPHAAGDAPARRRADRLGRARRPESLPGARAAGGRRPRAGAPALARRARRRDARARRRGVAAAGARRPAASSSRFVNEGHAAGASLPHSHSQLAWLPGPPPALRGGARPARGRADPRAGRARRRLPEVEPSHRTNCRSRPSEPSPRGSDSDLLGAALRCSPSSCGGSTSCSATELPLNAWLHDGFALAPRAAPRTTTARRPRARRGRLGQRRSRRSEAAAELEPPERATGSARAGARRAARGTGARRRSRRRGSGPCPWPA